MKYTLPTPDTCEGEEYHTRIGKAYAKSYVLLMEAVTLLEVIKDDLNEYNIDAVKMYINKYLSKLS